MNEEGPASSHISNFWRVIPRYNRHIKKASIARKITTRATRAIIDPLKGNGSNAKSG